MGTTSTYGFPYPEPTYPPQGDVQIKALAEAVEDTLSSIDADLSRPPVALLTCTNNTQQFTNGNSAPVKFSAATIDSAGGWNGTDTYTVKQAGVYQITGSFGWGAVDGGYRSLRLEVNGTALSGSQSSMLPIKDSDGLHVILVGTPATLVRCSVGDTIKLIAWSTSATTTAATGSVTTHPEYRPTLNIVKVSD